MLKQIATLKTTLQPHLAGMDWSALPVLAECGYNTLRIHSKLKLVLMFSISIIRNTIRQYNAVRRVVKLQ
jgi:hypothetical protein